MGDPIVHFEIIGRDAERLRSYYREMFGWEFEVGDTVADSVSAPGNYGFVDGDATGSAINGGVGGGGDYTPLTLFYVGVPNVEQALKKAESMGGQRRMGPEGIPGKLVVGRFTDPEGNLIGVAGPV